MKIGNLTIDNPFVLAPLAGGTDLAFRILCREYGAGLCYSEMISSHGLVHNQADSLKLIETTPADRPVAMQIFGHDPEIMAEAAAMLSELPIDLIDINMGCPMEKVVREGAGAALMKNTGQAEKIMAAVCKRAGKPVSIKIRTGWDRHTLTAPELARVAEDSGVAVIAIHARTWSDGFSGAIDLAAIRTLKKSVAIPIIGNGDIRSHEQGLAMMAETGCDGVMIGRAALGAPWIFAERINPLPSMHFRLQALSRHLEILEEVSRPELPNLAKLRNHSWKYFKSAPGAKSIRSRIEAAQSYGQLRDIVQELAARYQ